MSSVSTIHQPNSPVHAADLSHEFDLSLFAPLAPEQVYQLFLAVSPTGDARRHDSPEFWDSVELQVNSNCPGVPAVSGAVLRDRFMRHAASLRSHFCKYSLWAQVFPDEWFTFMNYGYYSFEPAPLQLVGAELDFRHAVAMYDRVGMQVELRDRDVLEVGCGRGGGASYLTRRYAPRSYVASDGTRSNIRFCQQVHRQAEAPRFVHAAAESLSFPDGSFDIILSIESCRYYTPFSAFVAGARRLLRQNGRLLLAYYTDSISALELRQRLLSGGFVLQQEEDISPHVLAAMSLFRQQDLLPLVESHATARLKRHYYELFSSAYQVDGLASGRSRYYCAEWRRS